jgi:rhodanese-related sulfurtransferase
MSLRSRRRAAADDDSRPHQAPPLAPRSELKCDVITTAAPLEPNADLNGSLVDPKRQNCQNNFWDDCRGLLIKKLLLSKGADMSVILIVVLVGLCVVIALWIKRTRDKHELESRSVTPEDLHSLLSANADLLLFDVRQPLDLLADAEIIPGAKRIPPKELLANPALIPKEKDAVVYCTCATDETGRRIVKLARGMHLSRVKLLKGGLSAWKEKGYSVVPYEKSFHLDTRS